MAHILLSKITKINWVTKNLLLEICFLFALTIVAGFLRLYRIGEYLVFLGDEGRDVLAVYNILHGHFTLLGPTASVGGFFLGPIYYYFMAPFLFLFRYDPIGPAIMVALFGIATVLLLYFFCRKYFGVYVGMIASTLYAVSPLVLVYSRSSWNPNLMPFFSLLTISLVLLAIERKKSILYISVGVCLGIMMQLHYLATFFCVALFVFFSIYTLVYQKSKQWFFTSGAKITGGFLIGWSPFLIFEIRHNFLNLGNIFSFIFYSKDTGVGGGFFYTLSDVFLRIFGHVLFALQYIESFSLFAAMQWITFIIITAASITLFLYKTYVAIKTHTRNKEVYLLLVLWLGISIILFGFYKKSIYDYYFGFLFPIPCIIVGSFFVWMIQRMRIGIWIATALLIYILYINLTYVPFRLFANHQKDQAKLIASFILNQAHGMPFNFGLISSSNSDHAYRYYFTVLQHAPVVIENSVNDPKRNSVTKQLFVVCESLPCAPLGHSLWEIAGFGRASITNHWHVSVVDVYRLVPYKGAL